MGKKIDIWVDGNGNKTEEVLCEGCSEVIGFIKEGEKYCAIWCSMCHKGDMKYGEKEEE